MKTVLVFAHQCAPFNSPRSTIGAQRPAQFAKYLPRFGWRAIVVCCDGSLATSTWRTDVERRVADALGEARADESVIVPTPRFADAGTLDRWWRKSVVGPPNVVHATMRKGLTAARQLVAGDSSLDWLECAKAAAARISRDVRIDLCIGEHSPDAGLHAARWYADEYAVPWIADFRDPWMQPFPRALRVLFEPRARALLSTASLVINVNARWSAIDAQLFGRPTATIPNGYDPEEFAGWPDEPKSDSFVVAYAGNVWPQMSPEVFFDGLRLLRDRVNAASFDRLRVRYRGGAVGLMRDLAARAGVADRLDAEGHVSRVEALRLVAGANVLLLFSIDSEKTGDEYLVGGLHPGKAFEYLAARRRILCVPGDRGLLEALVSDTGAGQTARNAEEVAAYFERALLAWRDGRRDSFEPRWDRVEAYARPRLTNRLAELMESVRLPSPVGVGAAAATV